MNDIGGFFIVLLIGFILGCSVSYAMTMECHRKDAIRQGVGEYYYDTAYEEFKFAWKKCECE